MSRFLLVDWRTDPPLAVGGALVAVSPFLPWVLFVPLASTPSCDCDVVSLPWLRSVFPFGVAGLMAVLLVLVQVVMAVRWSGWLALGPAVIAGVTTVALIGYLGYVLVRYAPPAAAFGGTTVAHPLGPAVAVVGTWLIALAGVRALRNRGEARRQAFS